jgi:UDP-N-acetyl-D-mannosaminuronic acid dehydrogenase
MDDAIVVGSGTTGTAVGAALASRGVKVGLYDNDPARRAALARGVPVFGEQSLREAVDAAGRNLHVVEELRPQQSPTVYLVCVPTPTSDSGGLDATFLNSAMAAITGVAHPGDAVFIRSTVPIGTTRRLAAQAKAEQLDLQFAFTPDRSIEGRSFADQFSLPQLVGGLDEKAARRAAALFATLGQVIDLGSAEAAEAAKLFANAWRAAAFAAANAMAMACEAHGLDARAIFAGTGCNYPRFSPATPGPVGGPCLLKDVRLLAASVPVGVRALLDGVVASETAAVALIADCLAKHLAGYPGAQRIALAGIAFKGVPPVDDIRGSVALALAKHIRERWPSIPITAWDAAMTADQIRRTGLLPADSLMNAANDAAAVVFCNNHPAFATIDLPALACVAANGAILYDCSGITAQFCGVLPNRVRHHVFGRGETRERSA